ncbi:MAG: hypothetical protein ACTSV2_20060 [Candidatus Thorarchaeota archaeon]
MSPDQELEKLAIERRQSITKEFAEKFADFRERLQRVPVNLAKEIAEEMKCPLQIAMVAYLINMDGILPIRDAITLLTKELNRLEQIGKGIPNLPGNIQEFAVAEGRWVSYIYGTFARQMELKVREISNLESSVDDDKLTVEKAMSVYSIRLKVAEVFILPVVQTWLKEHEASNSEDVLISIGPAITGWKLSTLKGKLIQVRRRNQALYRKLSAIIITASDSATVTSFVTRINIVVTELEKPLNQMNDSAASHLLLHIAPRPIGARGDRSSFVSIGMQSTRGGKAEPDMASPFDFLERDVRLAKRRSGDERTEFLVERIGRVLRVLRYQGTDLRGSIELCVNEIEERLDVTEYPKETVIDEALAKIASVSIEEQEEIAVHAIFEFVNDYVYR